MNYNNDCFACSGICTYEDIGEKNFINFNLIGFYLQCFLPFIITRINYLISGASSFLVFEISMLRAMDLYCDEECFGNESQTRGGILFSAVFAAIAVLLPNYIFF